MLEYLKTSRGFIRLRPAMRKIDRQKFELYQSTGDSYDIPEPLTEDHLIEMNSLCIYMEYMLVVF